MKKALILLAATLGCYAPVSDLQCGSATEAHWLAEVDEWEADLHAPTKRWNACAGALDYGEDTPLPEQWRQAEATCGDMPVTPSVRTHPDFHEYDTHTCALNRLTGKVEVAP